MGLLGDSLQCIQMVLSTTPKEMIKDIKFLTSEVRLIITQQQRIYLKKSTSSKNFNPISFVVKFKVLSIGQDLSNDASKLYEYLLKLKENDER